MPIVEEIICPVQVVILRAYVHVTPAAFQRWNARMERRSVDHLCLPVLADSERTCISQRSTASSVSTPRSCTSAILPACCADSRASALHATSSSCSQQPQPDALPCLNARCTKLSRTFAYSTAPPTKRKLLGAAVAAERMQTA